jgi:hypothetical protein
MLRVLFFCRYEFSLLNQYLNHAVIPYLFCAIILFTSITGAAQTNSNESTLSPELKQKVEEAKALADIAEAEKKIREAQYPKPTLSPPTGESKMTGDKSFIETQMMGFKSAACSTSKIADAIYAHNANIDTIFIYNENETKILMAYERTLSKISILLRRSKELVNLYATVGNTSKFTEEAMCVPTPVDPNIPQPPRALLPIASSVLGSAFDIMSYFRPNVEIKPETFEVDDKVIFSDVFRHLRTKYKTNIKLYNLSATPLSNRSIRLEESNLLRNLEKLLISKSDVEAIVARVDSLIERHQKNAECHKTKNEAKRSELLQKSQELTQFVAPYKSLTAQIDSLVKQLILDDDTKNSNTLTDYIRLESTHPLVETYTEAEKSEQNNKTDKPVYWLEVKAIEAGGSTRIKSRSIIEVFTGGNRVAHSGGSIVMYNLYDKTGKSVLSDTIVNYLDYKKAKSIASVTCN